MRNKLIQVIFVPSEVSRRGINNFFGSKTLPSFATYVHFRGKILRGNSPYINVKVCALFAILGGLKRALPRNKNPKPQL